LVILISHNPQTRSWEGHLIGPAAVNVDKFNELLKVRMGSGLKERRGQMVHDSITQKNNPTLIDKRKLKIAQSKKNLDRASS